MLDFPNNPSDGQVYTFNGTTFVWKAAPGLWQIAAQNGVPVEIVEADAGGSTASGWQVWGDKLVQWALALTVPDGADVPFLTPFKTGTTPNVFVTPIGDITGERSILFWASTIDHTKFRIHKRYINAPGVNQAPNVLGIATQNFFAFAIGEAPDDLKKPKTVQAVGGAPLLEYHDPAQIASWRIVGDTLECWGTAGADPGGSPIDVPFPKSYAIRPAVTANSTYGARFITTTAPSPLTGFRATVWNGVNGNENDSGYFWWHAIGKWDGVS